jgi:hypothetical protein
VGPTKDEVLKLLDVYARQPKPSRPVTLSPAYLRAIARWEGLPENAEGREKGWVFAAAKAFRRTLDHARLIP